jgi:C4-dicarboxylate-specific signal transduction histidine kinase
VQLYRTLSTAGSTAATFSHESSGNPIKAITLAAKALERRLQRLLGTQYDLKISNPIALITRTLKSLSVLGETTLRLIDHERRRLGRVEVHKVIQEILEIYRPFLEGRQVTIDIQLFSANPYLRGSAAAVDSIITNLLNNSLNAFEGAEGGGTENRHICVRTQLLDQQILIEVLDNGTGIQGISLKDIWLPGRSTRANGTGLGLTIVRDTVADLGGTVDAIANGELGGAQIRIILPIIGVN